MQNPESRGIVAGVCACCACSLLFASTVHAADGATTTPTTPTTTTATTTDDTVSALPTVVVAAERLNQKRSGIEVQTGASSYTIDSAAIAATPGGANVPLDQVILQAPDVVQDSFGQIHVRGDHNGLQYRLNGIILPEGISSFGQTLSPRLIASMNLITGALPAEYGLRTAGIVDLTTSSGLLQPGGSVSVYGGSHGTFQPSAEYGGSDGAFSYFVSADMLRNDLGIESPDASINPLHDHSTQVHGFGYFEDVLGADDRLSLILGLSAEHYQIPNQRGLQPDLGLQVLGDSDYLSDQLNENQHQLTQYAIVSWQHSQGALDWQSSVSARYSSLDFEPDWRGDLLYNGIAQNAVKADTAVGWQTDSSYALGTAHTLRAGWYLQHDDARSDTMSQVVQIGPDGSQISDIPLSIADDSTDTQWIGSLYLQDEWRALTALTVNYGARLDTYHAYSSGGALSPRLNVVWQAAAGTTVHAGYSRYFTPPPFELIGSQTLSRFAGTSALAPGAVTLDDQPVAERADYYDVGAQQRLFDRALTLGVDSYAKLAHNLLDEGQFGAPVVLTPFNYRRGRIAGLELTANYVQGAFSAYGNLAFQSARARGVESSQFNFDPQQLAYIAGHYIALDHAERVSASGGASYEWRGTRASLDLLFGTGLREDLVLPSGYVIPNGTHTPSYTQVNLGISHAFAIGAPGPLTVRLDVTNLFDKIYQIRSGNGVGVFAPQYGPRRGLFFGLSQQL
jgi:outer membrane receptor protein involved in Fe transport